MKIAMLAQVSETTWLVVNALKRTYPDLLLGIEEREPRKAFLRRRVKKFGVFRVLGQVLFMVYLHTLKKHAKVTIAEILRTAGLSIQIPDDFHVERFDSVNSLECQQWLGEERPDVVIVNGTRIICRETLEACEAVFLNIHCGITPAYRGVHGAYWALANGDEANAGVTVHLVDKGIDSGEIVYQCTIEIGSQDNFLTYPFRQYVAAIPLLERALADLGNRSLRAYRRTDIPSALWYHPTLITYFKNRWKKGVR